MLYVFIFNRESQCNLIELPQILAQLSCLSLLRRTLISQSQEAFLAAASSRPSVASPS